MVALHWTLRLPLVGEVVQCEVVQMLGQMMDPCWRLSEDRARHECGELAAEQNECLCLLRKLPWDPAGYLPGFLSCLAGCLIAAFT